MRRVLFLPALLATVSLFGARDVQPSPNPPATELTRGSVARLNRLAGLQAVRDGRWEAARPALERALAADANQPEVFYALAVCLARSSDLQAALNHLVAALQSGFQDYRLLETDPALSALRSTAAYRQLLEAIAARREASDSLLEAAVRSGVTDSSLRCRRYANPRMVLLTDLDEGVADHVVSALAGYESRLRDSLFPNGLRHAIVVHALRSRDGTSSKIPGAFNPASRTLYVNVAAPAGGVLKELARALHFDDQAAYGQVHAAWLREGIPSLYERVSPGSGPIRGLPDQRLTNLKSSLGKSDYIPLALLLGRRASAMDTRAIGQARCLLFWLQETGKLSAFYRAYVELHEEDPSGRLALEKSVGRSVTALEADWLAYIRNHAERAP